VSHRQQAMRIAINTGCLALIRPQLFRSRTGIPYQCFKEPASRNPGGPLPTSGWQSAREETAVASTFQRGRWQCVD
jgi:hypothetical protein